MSGIAVNEDAVNLYYYMKAKSVVSMKCLLNTFRLKMFTAFSSFSWFLQYRWALWKLNDDGNEVGVCLEGLTCCDQLTEAHVLSATLLLHRLS